MASMFYSIKVTLLSDIFLRFGEGWRLWWLVGLCVICIGLVSGAGNFFIGGVLVGRIGSGDRRPEFTRMLW